MGKLSKRDNNASVTIMDYKLHCKKEYTLLTEDEKIFKVKKKQTNFIIQLVKKFVKLLKKWEGQC